MQVSQQDQKTQPLTAPVTPDDQGIVHIDGYIKIYDPSTQVTLVEARE